MVMGATPVYAGHAGESGVPLIMPHQLMSAMIILGLVLAMLVVLSVLVIRFLMKIHQRVRRLEQELRLSGDASGKPHLPK